MRIRFTGPEVVRRLVGLYEWSLGAGFVQDVDLELAAELLTAPDGRFVVDESEPLLEVVGDAEDVVGLALAGIGSLDDLAGLVAGLSRTRVRQVAEAMGMDRRRVRDWAKAAKERMEGGEGTEGPPDPVTEIEQIAEEV